MGGRVHRRRGSGARSRHNIVRLKPLKPLCVQDGADGGETDVLQGQKGKSEGL